jgi:hypothetical protein
VVTKTTSDKLPYLLLNPEIDGRKGQPGAGQPERRWQYTKAPNIPTPMAALAQMAAAGAARICSATSRPASRCSRTSAGKAVELIQNRLDMQVFIYMSQPGQVA